MVELRFSPRWPGPNGCPAEGLCLFQDILVHFRSGWKCLSPFPLCSVLQVWNHLQVGFTSLPSLSPTASAFLGTSDLLSWGQLLAFEQLHPCEEEKKPASQVVFHKSSKGQWWQLPATYPSFLSHLAMNRSLSLVPKSQLPSHPSEMLVCVCDLLWLGLFVNLIIYDFFRQMLKCTFSEFFYILLFLIYYFYQVKDFCTWLALFFPPYNIKSY